MAGQATGEIQHKGWEASQQPGSMDRSVPGASLVLPQQLCLQQPEHPGENAAWGALQPPQGCREGC